MTSNAVIGSATKRDILCQPDAWAAAVDEVRRTSPALHASLRTLAPRHVLVTGCGSPFFLAESTVALWGGATSGPAIVTAVPASELDDPRWYPWPGDTLLVVLSRSGATTEVLDAVASFRRHGGAVVWAITCRSGSPLTEIADEVIAIDEGYETSVAQTRSFTTMLVAVEALAAALAGAPTLDAPQVEAAGRAAVTAAQSTVAALELVSLERIDLLGSAARYGMVREAMLKLTEMSLTHSSAYHVLEYRHGPKAMVDEHTLVVGVLDPCLADEQQVIAECAALGGRTLTITTPPDAPLAAAMPTLQLLAHSRAIARGLDPDHPRHLSAVVHLDGASRSEQPATTGGKHS